MTVNIAALLILLVFLIYCRESGNNRQISLTLLTILFLAGNILIGNEAVNLAIFGSPKWEAVPSVIG